MSLFLCWYGSFLWLCSRPFPAAAVHPHMKKKQEARGEFLLKTDSTSMILRTKYRQSINRSDAFLLLLSVQIVDYMCSRSTAASKQQQQLVTAQHQGSIARDSWDGESSQEVQQDNNRNGRMQWAMLFKSTESWYSVTTSHRRDRAILSLVAFWRFEQTRFLMLEPNNKQKNRSRCRCKQQ